MSKPRFDSAGLEGLPLKLVIVAVIVGISTPIVYSGLHTYEKGKLDVQLRAEVGALADIARLVFSGGPGNAQIIEVDLSGGATSHVDYVLVGDVEGGAYQCCIRYRVKGSPEQSYLVEGPNVPLMSSAGAALKLLEGRHNVNLECKGSGASMYVEVGVVD
jgi:hypothetical protein